PARPRERVYRLLKNSCSRPNFPLAAKAAPFQNRDAITISAASLGIGIGPEPLYRTSQGIVGGHGLPSQFALGFVGAGPHLYPSPANGFDCGARLPAQQAARNCLIDQARHIGNKVWELHFGRRQTRNRAEFIQNLFQREVLAAEDIALAAPAFFENL